MLQCWLNTVIDSLYWVSLGIGVLIVLMHRVLGISGAYVPILIAVTPIVVWFWVQRTPIQERVVIQYAESVTGQTGLLWFGSEVPDADWQQQVDSQWVRVPIPDLSVPSEWKGMVLVLCVAVATLWVPLKKATPFQPLVETEMTQLESTLEQLEALTVEEDTEIEEWREQISELAKDDNVSSILRQSDYLQEQMSQRQSEMMDAIQEGMDALESGEEQSMTQAMKSLQDQGLIPQSAKDEEALASQSEGASQQGQSQSGEQKSTTSKEQTNQTQNGQQQNGQQSSTQNQSGDKQSNQSGEQQQSKSSQNANSSVQQQHEQLQQQMSQIQERMQQMQQQQQSSGIQSLNNEQLKQIQQQMQKMSQQAQSGTGQSSEAQPEQSPAEGGNEKGEPCELGTPNCVPSKGGETAPLTYGTANPLSVSDGNLASIQGVTEVDWNHNVYFGQGAGQFSGTASSQSNTGIVSGGPTTSSFNNERIPPNQRGVVQRFFSTPSTNQGVNNDNNTQP